MITRGRSLSRPTVFRPFFAAAVLALALAAGLRADALIGSATLVPDNATEAWRGTGVVYARIVDGEDGTLLAEEWLDRRTGAARQADYDRTPQGVVRHITVEDGNRVAQWTTLDPTRVYLYDVSDEKGAPYNRLAGSATLLKPSRGVDAGEARIVGNGEVRGRPSWKVWVQPGSEAPPGFELVYEVDQRTFLPLQWVARSDESEPHVVLIEQKQLGSEDVPRSLFSTDVPWTFRDLRLAYGEIGDVVPFTVYSLGRTYRDLLFLDARYQEDRAASKGSVQIAPELFVQYGYGGRRRTTIVELTEQSDATEDARLRLEAFRGRGEARTVRIDGEPRTVYFLDTDRQPVFFAVVLGDTLVKGHATLPLEELMTVLESLRPVD